MDKIEQQVKRAQRRLVLQQFLSIASWWLFTAMLVAVIGLTIPKIWPLEFDKQTWMWSWIGGGIGGGFLFAVIWTYLHRRSRVDAAIEIDHRFGLKERVTSVLTLQPAELESEVGRALMDDTLRRIDQIDVRDNFPVRANWRSLLPLLPAIAIFVLASGFIPDATPEKEATAASQKLAEKKQIEKSAKELQKRLAEVKKKAEEEGLKDADAIFKELQKGLNELTAKNDIDRKNALVKINNLAKDLEKRREKLGGADKLRDQMQKMKDLQQGPADKIAKAMKEGDFGKALEELKKLQEGLKADELTEEQKEQLAKQLEQLQKKLQEMVDAHNQAKQDLEEQIKQQMAAGNVDEANKLQNQLDKLNQMNQQMDQLQQMAENLGQCKECMQNGDMQNAANQMAKLGDQLQQLQEQMDQLETLDEVLDQIAQAKDSMNCKQCGGQGCEACMGGFMGQGGMQGDQPGFGLGEGQGQGERPEEKNDTSFYESQVRGNVQAGEAVRTGSAGGPNRAGKSLEDVKDQIESSLNKDADPLIDTRLPRKEREHAKQYFERFRN